MGRCQKNASADSGVLVGKLDSGYEQKRDAPKAFAFTASPFYLNVALNMGNRLGGETGRAL